MLEWLEKWYINQCDGDWEHMFGVKIDTLDNPGWSITIDLEGTSLESKPFDFYQKYVDENDWIICRVKDNKFDAGGDPFKLEKIIEIFKNWVEMTGEYSE